MFCIIELYGMNIRTKETSSRVLYCGILLSRGVKAFHHGGIMTESQSMDDYFAFYGSTASFPKRFLDEVLSK